MITKSPSFFFCFFFTLLILQQIISVSASCTPTQIHLALSDAYTSNPTTNSSLKVIFHTQEPCSTAYISLSTSKSSAQRISATAINLFQAIYEQGSYKTYVHVFDFPQLDFSKTYQYTCYPGDFAFLGKAQGPFKFYLPSPNYSRNQLTKVVMFGDMDHSEHGMPTINKLIDISQNNFPKISAFIHIGDISYDLEKQAGIKGDKYMQVIQQFSATMPYMVTAGNHENLYNYSNFNMRFRMPNFQQSQNHYYSFNLGNMHFVSWNSDLILEQPDLDKYMLDWLQQDLLKAYQNRENRPWIIAYTHHPIYCSRPGDPSCNKNHTIFSKFENLMIKYKVDLVVSGHVHFYERMLPIKKGKIAPFQVNLGDDSFNEIINPQSPVYVLQGMAGHGGDEADSEYLYEGKEWTAKVSKDYSYLAVSSQNSTHLLIEDFLSNNGSLFDYFYVIKSDSKKYTRVPLFGEENDDDDDDGEEESNNASKIGSSFFVIFFLCLFLLI